MHRKIQLSGLTLIELLVAIGIFAFVSVITFNGINVAVKTKERVASASDREAEIETALTIMVDDLMQLAPRPVRDASGNLLPAYTYNKKPQQKNYPLAFTRSGVPQVGLLYEHGLQRVAYDYDQQTKQLLRIVWPVLDLSVFSEPEIYPVLSNVESVVFRQLDDQFKEYSSWPPESSVVRRLTGRVMVNPLVHLPYAIELDLELGDLGNIKRIIPGLSSPYDKQLDKSASYSSGQ